jgi:hypothetical protein
MRNLTNFFQVSRNQHPKKTVGKGPDGLKIEDMDPKKALSEGFERFHRLPEDGGYPFLPPFGL